MAESQNPRDGMVERWNSGTAENQPKFEKTERRKVRPNPKRLNYSIKFTIEFQEDNEIPFFDIFSNAALTTLPLQLHVLLHRFVGILFNLTSNKRDAQDCRLWYNVGRKIKNI